MLSSAKKYKMLDFVGFNALINWSVQYLGDSAIKFNGKYPLMRIGDFLTRNKTVVIIQDGVKYKRVTIRVRNGGVVLRDEVMGENIGTKRQFLVSEGQFILSKIDARNGAMGIIPANLNGAVVTQDFLPYDIDTTLVNPQYFVLVCTTKQFITFCQSCSSGTTNRQRVDEAQFLNIKIPVPLIEEQNKLVEEYNKQVSVASDSELLVTIKQSDIKSLLFTELGVEISKGSALHGLSTVSFSALNRWDIAYLQNTANYTTKYRSLKLQNCIEYFMKSSDGKSLRMETYKMPSKNFHYIGMEHIEKVTGQLIATPVVKGSQIKSQTIVVPNGYFIYGKLRPYLNKFWYNNTNWNDIVCSSEFFVFKIKDDINTSFFEYVLGSNIVQEQIADLASGARMPRITEDIFMNIQIPIPPIEIQNEIAKQIDKITEDIKGLKEVALKKRTLALTNYENQIFD